MKFSLEQKITLAAFDVSFYDRREPKPRALHTERVIVNGGRLNALDRLGLSPAGWITQQFEARGFAVQQIKRGPVETASVDLNALWTKTAAEKALRQLGANAAKALKGAN